MLRPVPSSDCDRARQAASAAVDGELSELERVILDAHLAVCPECDAFADELGSVAGLLRAAEPELLSHPVAFRRPPRRARSFTLAVAVGAAALTGALGFVFGESLSPAGGGSAASSAAASASLATSVSLAERLFAFAPTRRIPRAMPRPGENVAV
jgi:predicted anti-sigma-YlaC factor YlaD